MRLHSTPDDHKNHTDFEGLAAQIPGHAKVVAAEWLVSHVSNRRDAYTLRFGLMDAEYLVFWLSTPKLRPDEKTVIREALDPKGAFGVVERRGIFVLARRGHDPKLNAALLRAL